MSLDIVMKRVTGIELIEQKIGKAIGLEQAAQKAVYQFQSRGLFKPENERIHEYEKRHPITSKK